MPWIARGVPGPPDPPPLGYGPAESNGDVTDDVTWPDDVMAVMSTAGVPHGFYSFIDVCVLIYPNDERKTSHTHMHWQEAMQYFE